MARKKPKKPVKKAKPAKARPPRSSAAARAAGKRVFYDKGGRKRAVKGGRFLKGKAIAPLKREPIRRAFRPARPIDRAARIEKLPRKLPRGAAGKVRIRSSGKPSKKRGGRAGALEKLFGARFRTVSDFAELVERDGRLLGKAKFHVQDPVSGTEERTVEKAVRRATERATKKASGLVAMTVVTSANGQEVGRETVFVRVDQRAEVVGGAMSAIFRGLREGGFAASAGHQARSVTHLEEAEELDVEILVYSLD